MTKPRLPLPGGPSNIVVPFIRYLRDPYGVLPALIRKHGDPFLLPIPGSIGSVVTGDPEGIKTVMSADPDTFVSFRTEATEGVLGEHSLFFESGAKHKASRKLLSPPFHGSRIRAYGRVMQEIAIERTSRWEPGTRFDLQAPMGFISIDVIIRTVLGVVDPERVALFHRVIVDGMDSVTPAVMYFKLLRHEFFGFGPWARARRMVTRLNRLLSDEVEKRRASGRPGDDVLDMLLSAKYDDGLRMSDDEIRDKLYDMIVAGYETTGVALAWAGYEASRNPAVLARLLAEIESLGPDPDPDEVARLPYLDAVCNETLRLHPAFVILTRRLARPITLKGYDLPPGMAISVAVGAAHFREESFPDAHAFKPERFLGRVFTPFEYLPFGGGAQRCLASAFALYEMKIVLATIMARFRLDPLRKSIRHAPRAITIGPARGIPMRVRERRAT